LTCDGPTTKRRAADTAPESKGQSGLGGNPNPMESKTHNLNDCTVSGLLSEIEKSAAELNRASDLINRNLKAIEERLVGANTGVEVFLLPPLVESEPKTTVGSTSNDDTFLVTDSYQDRLGFGKAPEDGWCLLIKRVHIQDSRLEESVDEESDGYSHTETTDQIYPVLQASRELRIAALGRMKEFLQVFKGAIELRVDAIHNSSFEEAGESGQRSGTEEPTNQEPPSRQEPTSQPTVTRIRHKPGTPITRLG
jgi:hypothetical protein